jgi:hypothetical protein
MATKKRGTKRAGTKRHKKQKQRQRQRHSEIMTIPELRKAFESIETFLELHANHPRKELVKLFQQEWKKTFHKEIETKEAEAYVEHALEELKGRNPKHRRHAGGAAPLAGAFPTYDTRPGVYTSPGVNQGSYPHVPAYVDRGFWNPEIGRQYDPVPGQTHYPSATPYGLGSNQAGGRTKKRRRNQKGGGIFDAMGQFFMRPTFSSTPPPNVLDDVTTASMAKTLPPGGDPSQFKTPYQSNLTGIGLSLPNATLSGEIAIDPSGNMTSDTSNNNVWYNV